MIHITTTNENDSRNVAIVRCFLDEVVNGGRQDLIDELWTTDMVWQGGSLWRDSGHRDLQTVHGHQHRWRFRQHAPEHPRGHRGWRQGGGPFYEQWHTDCTFILRGENHSKTCDILKS